MRLTPLLTGVALVALAGCGGGPDPSPSDRDAPLAGGSYHVSRSGSDADPGTRDRPWRTIQHAANAARAGDVVVVHGGTYAQDVLLHRSGTAQRPITFRIAGAARVVVRSFELKQGVSHVRLRGFRVRGFQNWGITLAGDNHHVELSHLHVSGGETGIRFTVGYSGQRPEDGPVSHVLVEDCIVRDALYTGIDGTPGPCSHMTFRRLEVYGNGLVGGPSFGADGLAVERGRYITVEDCNIHDNGGDGIDLNSRNVGGHARGVIVRLNIVARNRLNGIKLWAGGRMERNAVWGQGLNPVDVGIYDCSAQVIHNTVAYNMWDSAYGARDYAAAFGYPDPGLGGRAPRVRLILRHNIFAFNTGPAQGTPTGIYLGPAVELVGETRNVFFSRTDEEIFAGFLGKRGRGFTRADIRNGAWARKTGYGLGDLAVNPRFAGGWPDVDLHLRPGSPAQGRGAH